MDIGGFRINIPFIFQRLDPSKISDSDPLYLLFDRILAFLNFFILLSVVVAVGMIIYSGIMYITSTGEEEKIRKATGALTAAIVGMVIVFSVRIILIFLIDTFLS